MLIVDLLEIQANKTYILNMTLLYAGIKVIGIKFASEVKFD